MPVPAPIFAGVLKLEAAASYVGDVLAPRTHYPACPAFRSKFGAIFFAIRPCITLLIVSQLLPIRFRVVGVKVSS